MAGGGEGRTERLSGGARPKLRVVRVEQRGGEAPCEEAREEWGGDERRVAHPHSSSVEFGRLRLCLKCYSHPITIVAQGTRRSPERSGRMKSR